MKKIKTYTALFLSSLLIVACGTNSKNEDHGHEHNEGAPHEEKVFYSAKQFTSMGMEIDTFSQRNISSFVEVNGQLEVPPQNEATVTAIIGSNIISIEVIEGDKIKKGQVLAYLGHPNLIKIQTEYIKSWNQLQFLEKEYQRQKKLYEEKVGSGKDFQKTEAAYFSMIGEVKGYEAQLKSMNLNLKQLQKSNIFERVPLVSPIDGYVRMVEIKTGQYVMPATELFEIVNIEHIHADFMVFEKDMHKAKIGQKIIFSSESLGKKELTATILSVGKAFEQDPKAIHLHAEIENKEGLLIPGMYVRGRIVTGNVMSYALPEEGVVHEKGNTFIFTAKKLNDKNTSAWEFTPVEVKVGSNDNGWVEIKLFNPLPKGTLLAWNNAYYLLSELKKEEAEHSH